MKKLILLIMLLALLLPTSAYAKKTTLTATPSGGTSLLIEGTGFLPSAGGQMVILWVGYPDDYCVADVCHGFYAYPYVNDDGTFSVTYDNVVLQAGTGIVNAREYFSKPDQWKIVAETTYVAP